VVVGPRKQQDRTVVPLLVVAAAVVREGRVLAARRSRPPRLAGGWEFPGGKVEADETEPDALVRELAEELDVRVEVRDRVAEATDAGIRLVLYRAELCDGEPAPRADHDALRWLAADELDDVEWLPIDRELLPPVRALLQRHGEG
jgi:8-oxo-dGTP diphosphatase